AKEPAVDLRVERLHAPVEHLRKAGVVAHLADRHAGVRKELRRPAGREDLEPEVDEAARELGDAALVAHAEECPRVTHRRTPRRTPRPPRPRAADRLRYQTPPPPGARAGAPPRPRKGGAGPPARAAGPPGGPPGGGSKQPRPATGAR